MKACYFLIITNNHVPIDSLRSYEPIIKHITAYSELRFNIAERRDEQITLGKHLFPFPAASLPAVRDGVTEIIFPIQQHRKTLYAKEKCERSSLLQIKKVF